MKRRRYLTALGTASTVSVAGCLGGGDSGEPTPTFDSPFEREVDPSRTYLRTSNDDAGDARPIDVESLGLQPGATVRLVRLGSFTGSSGGTGMTGVFSGSETLLASEKRERVPDAVDAGEDYETSPTYNGEAETDIPEDFLIADNEETETSATVTVPEGATHLFVAAIDNLYEDNAHGETRFAVRIESA